MAARERETVMVSILVKGKAIATTHIILYQKKEFKVKMNAMIYTMWILQHGREHTSSEIGLWIIELSY